MAAINKYLRIEDAEKLNRYFQALDNLTSILYDPDLRPFEKPPIYERRKNQIIQEYASLIGTSIVKDIEKHARLLEQEKDKETKLKESNILDFLEETDEKNWLAQGLFANDLIFFTASAKTGKTDLMKHLIKCVVTGDQFLGYPVRQGTVLEFQLEESNHSIKTKLKFHGFETKRVKEKLKTNKYFIYRYLDVYNNFNFLLEQVEKYNPVLVIIDTVISSMANSNISPSQPEFSLPFRKIQSEICIKHNCCVLALHHLNKQGVGAGTYALYSIGGGNVTFTREGTPEENLSKMSFNTRDIGQSTATVKRSLSSNIVVEYKMVEETEDSEFTNLRDRLVRHLLNVDEATREEVMQELEIVEEETLQQVIVNAVQHQLIDFKHDDEDNVVFYISEEKRNLYESSIHLVEYRKKLDVVDEIINKLDTLDPSKFEDYLQELASLHGDNWKSISKSIYHSLNKEQKVKLAMFKFPHKYHNLELEGGKRSVCVSIEVKDGKPINHLFNIFSSTGELLHENVSEPWIDATLVEEF